MLSLLGFVREEQVAEVFRACDAAVLPSGEGVTSGSLILALSMGLPVVVADVPTARELVRDGKAGWLFRPHDLPSLRGALERAGSDPGEALARGRCSFEIAKGLEWKGIARELARLLDQIMATRSRRV